MADRRRRTRSTHPESVRRTAAPDRSGTIPDDAAPAAAPQDTGAELTEETAEARQLFALDGLAIAGITRRRAGWIAGAAFTMWIVLVFARQVGDASAKSGEVDQSRADNAALQ